MATATTLTQSEIAPLMQKMRCSRCSLNRTPDYQCSASSRRRIQARRDRKSGHCQRIAQASPTRSLSSALLEYETILQRYPDDQDVRRPPRIEAKHELWGEPTSLRKRSHHQELHPNARTTENPHAGRVDDGRQASHRIFVESKPSRPAF